MIGTYLDLSTGHLPESERVRLDVAGEFTLVGRPDGELPKTVTHGEGWWVHVPGDFLQEFQEKARNAGCPALAGLLGYAASQGCYWINFDVDGEQIEELTWYGDEEEVPQESGEKTIS